MQSVWRIAPVLCAVWMSYGQGTQVDLRNQSKNVDFSSGGPTKPAQTGATLPAVCSVGEIFFLTSAQAGQNMYACTTANVWNVEGDVGASGQLSDFQVTTNGAVMAIGPSCAAATPCNVRFGDNVYSIAGSATATISGGTGVAYIYVSHSGVVTVGHSMTLTCVGCTSQSGVTAFPTDSVPLFTWTATNGVWNANGGVDRRAFLSTKTVSAGLGLISTDVGGETLLQVNSAQVGLLTSAPASSSSSCAPGSWATDSNYFYVCTSTNIWMRIPLTAF